MRHKRKSFLLFFDRSFSKGFGLQIMWLFLIMLAVYLVLIVLSYSGDFYDSNGAESNGRWYDVLFFLMDPGKPPEYLFAPFALIIALVGLVIFSGMLISVISNILSLRVENYQHGETTYKVSHHVIILGFNRSVPSLFDKIQKKYPKSHILLMCERDSTEIRDWLHANIDDSIERNLIIMSGAINANDDLERLSLGCNPKEIYIVGEEGREDHDDVCLECVKKISAIILKETACHSTVGRSLSASATTEAHEKVPCYVQINSDTMFSLLQQVDFCGKPKERAIDNLDFHPFNFNEIWGQKVLSLTSFDGNGYLPLDGSGIGKESDRSVHLILIGMTGLAKALATNAAQVLHFPNFKEGNYQTYSRISFIDPDAGKLGERFRNRHSVLFDLARWKADGEWQDPLADADSTSPYRYLGPKNFMDIEWEFIKGDVAEPEIRKYLKESCSESNRIVTIALCGEDSERNLAISMGLPSEVIDGPSLNMVLVRQKESDIAVQLMRELPGRGNRFRAFGMLNECYSENLLNDTYGTIIDYLYNTSNGWIPHWDNNDILNKWSSNYSANMLFVKLRSLGFKESEFSKDPETSFNKKFEDGETRNQLQMVEHNRWNTERILLGFRPLNEDEQKEFDIIRKKSTNFEDIKIEFKELKDKYKARQAHVDICSNYDLTRYDPNPKVRDYDTDINSNLGELYSKIKENERISSI
ncbi:MAG: hypothetical protein K2N48_06600 [Muribaculaceae bacterium]|nr:hypothetical protein [Muribaculaceae bacterium]